MAKLTKEEKKALKKQRPNIFKEFAAFLSRGNIIDMATGVIVATAFTKVINSLTNNIFMPWVNFIMFKVTKGQMGELITVLNKEPYYLYTDVLAEDGKTVIETTKALNPACIFINWGTFIEAVFNFIMIAAIIFFTVRIIKSIRQKMTYVKETIHAKRIAEEKAKAEKAAAEAAEAEAKAKAEAALVKAAADKAKANDTSTNELLVEIINLLNK